MRETHLHVITPTGKKHLATRTTLSATFSEQCQAYAEKHGAPLEVITEADATYPRSVRVFYPDGDARLKWQSEAARALPLPRTDEDVDTVFTEDTAALRWADFISVSVKADSEAALRRPPIPAPVVNEPSPRLAKSALAVAHQPDCQCDIEVEVFVKTYRNGTKHLYVGCTGCYQITSRAVPRAAFSKALVNFLLKTSDFDAVAF